MKKSKLLASSLAAMLILAGCGTKDSSKSDGDVKVQERPAETVATTTTTTTPTTTTTVTTTQTEEAVTTKVSDSSETDPKKDTFIIPIDEIPVTKSKSETEIRDEETNNWGLVSDNGKGGRGFAYDTEGNGFYGLSLSNFLLNNQYEWTDVEEMAYNDRSKGFTFNGTPYIVFKYKDSKNKDYTAVPNEESTAVYVETAVNEEGEEMVTGFAYSIEHSDKKNPIGFGNQNYKSNDWIGKYTDYFVLGDSKDRVEELIGKGYEHDNYAFYSTEEGEGENMMKTYTIIEYGKDDTVQKVFILARDLIQ